MIQENLKMDKYQEIEMTRAQREYRNYANGLYSLKENKSKIRYLEKNLNQNQKEKISINTQLYVAFGSTHVKLYEENMHDVEMHVDCQEKTQNIINVTKTQINHLNMQIKRTERGIHDLKMNCTSDHQHNEKLQNATKILNMLENRVNVAKNRECMIISENNNLRNIINNMLFDRALFNKLWQRMVERLAYDKKFFIDMVDRAILAFNQGTDLCNKLDAIREKGDRDKNHHIREILDLLRKLDADHKTQVFLSVKGANRKLSDLENREYKRREEFRDYHIKTTDLYNKIIGKIVKFSNAGNIATALDQFNKREDAFFAHFNYMNELMYQIELLNESTKQIYGEINQIRSSNQKQEMNQFNELESLKLKLFEEKEITLNDLTAQDNYDKNVHQLLTRFHEIFKILKCDDQNLFSLLGDHSNITIFNVKKFLTILEERLNLILSYVYHIERSDPSAEDATGGFVVRDVDRITDDQIRIEDIVVVQQCAECAEGVEVNRYDEEIVWPLNVSDIKDKVRDKVKAPEIQYRLHNISKCRLPRSRMIVNKRYQ